MANLQDIATELDVSVSLVSKVLNNRFGTGGASVRTSEAIRKKAKELGYHKNLSAAALAKGRQGVIGVFIHRKGVPASGIAEAMVEGIADEAGKAGQRLMLQFFETALQFKALCPQVDRNVLDGLIVGGISHPELIDDLVQMQQRGVAVVTIHDMDVDPRLTNIRMDQTEVSRLATLHLAERGCRNIAHIHVDESRFRGYRAALAERGLTFRPELVFNAQDYTSAAGESAVQALLAAKVACDGLVAQSDNQSIGALNALLKAGHRVPDDIRLIGVDDAPFCELSIVPLSSISQEFRLRGRRSVELLLNKMSGKKVSSITVAPVLRHRESSN
jgi:LacI family transcriptional regulator